MKNERLPHDASYKQIFSNPDMVASLLRDFVSEDLSVNWIFRRWNNAPAHM